jgi:NadR type nicotinamide-nucleotide adenylyltransferase
MSGVARIAILGAESTGKSTLAEALAMYYDTVWVPEYLREFVETRGRVPDEEDQFGIAREQHAREDAAAPAASRFLFCDTTPLMTAVYSQHYWGRVDQQLAALAAPHDYAFTLVSAPDLPWEPDGLMRDSDEVRQAVHRLLVDMLEQRGVRFLLVRGGLTNRLRQAEDALGPRAL